MLIRQTGSDSLRTAWPKDVVTPARVLGKALRVFLALALLGHVLLFLVVLVSSLYLRSGNPPSTALMVYRRVTQHESIRPVHFVRLRQIPRSARGMVIRLEDYRFYQHPGVDLGALRDAYLINHSLRATVVGGSTIPMKSVDGSRPNNSKPTNFPTIGSHSDITMLIMPNTVNC